MIAKAAYFRALERGFEHGDSVDDWLGAELEIDAKYDLVHHRDKDLHDFYEHLAEEACSQGSDDTMNRLRFTLIGEHNHAGSPILADNSADADELELLRMGLAEADQRIVKLEATSVVDRELQDVDLDQIKFHRDRLEKKLKDIESGQTHLKEIARMQARDMWKHLNHLLQGAE